ncbi:MAG: prolipoprotein diacylglyceryl transferase [Ruminococcaceae bacterium]|nr:prolipoprotein diacylglyceryl transferase [Oscillospiraceae bacterium]
MNNIAFPGLSIGPLKIYESFNLFGLTIHYYGLIIAIGIVIAYIFCSNMAKNYDIDKENILDAVLVGLPSAVVCARLYYVIFSWDYYKYDFASVFKIWEGGLAIYGAVIGAVTAVFIYCRIKKIKVTKIYDTCSFGLLIGQIIGRFGNFVNAEAYGAETTLPWRMELIDLGISVHPTFLYESLWNLGVFLFLVLFYRKKQKFSGEMFLAYISAYGLGRFFIEALRSDSLYLGPIKVSQLLALLCFIAGVCSIIYFRYKNKNIEK